MEIEETQIKVKGPGPGPGPDSTAARTSGTMGSEKTQKAQGPD